MPSSKGGEPKVQAELRAPLLVLLLLLPLLAIAAWQIDTSVARAQAYQRDIRLAEISRARVLRFQLDEETGIRGFYATGDRLFLEPFYKARGAMSEAIGSLQVETDRLGVPAIRPMLEAQKTLNNAWLETVAIPLLSGVRVSSNHGLAEHGKRLVDAFRNRDLEIIAVLNQAADAADHRSARALEQLTFYLVLSSTAIAVGAGIFGFFRARSAREAFEYAVRLDNQKRIAASLQTAFINKDLPRLRNVALHGTYVPADNEAQIGGDWYDAFQLPSGRLLFSIGDVAGHGVDAAVVMSRARQAIIAAAMGEPDPAKVLEQANQALLLQEVKMVTAICGFVDPDAFEIVYSTAGHPAPILVSPEAGATFLPQSGVPLGLFGAAHYATYVRHLSDGAVMFLYTDGLIEHKRDIVSGEKQLLIESVRAAQTSEDPSSELHRLVIVDGRAPDDVAILTIRFNVDPATDSGRPIFAVPDSLPTPPPPTVSASREAVAEGGVTKPVGDAESDVVSREPLRFVIRVISCH